MAQRVIVETLDDVDGGQADETVRFGLDGTWYELDLSADNAVGLRDVLARYVQAGRRESQLTRAAHRTTVETEADPTAVRAWARANGHEVSPRGRLAAGLVEQFHAAGN